MNILVLPETHKFLKAFFPPNARLLVAAKRGAQKIGSCLAAAKGQRRPLSVHLSAGKLDQCAELVVFGTHHQAKIGRRADPRTNPQRGEARG